LDHEKLLVVNGHPEDVEIFNNGKPPFVLIFRQVRRQ